MCNKEYACDWHLRSTFARNGFDSSLAARRSVSVRVTLCFLFFCLLQQLAAPQDQVGNAAQKYKYVSSFCRLCLGNIKTTWKSRKWTPPESPKTNSLPGHYHKLRQQKLVQSVILLCRNLQITKVTPHPKFTLTLVGQPRRQADYLQEYNTMICAGRHSGPKQSLSCRNNPPSCSKHRNKQYNKPFLIHLLSTNFTLGMILNKR